MIRACGVAYREESFRPTKRGASALIARHRTLEVVCQTGTAKSLVSRILISLSVTKRPANAFQVGVSVINHVTMSIFARCAAFGVSAYSRADASAGSSLHGIRTNSIQRGWETQVAHCEAGDRRVDGLEGQKR